MLTNAVFAMQMVQPSLHACTHRDEAAAQQQGDTILSEGCAPPRNTTAADIGPSTSAAADAHLDPEACQRHPSPHATHEAAAAQQPEAQNPSPLPGSMPAPSVVLEAELLQHGSELGTRVVLIPAEAAHMADPDADTSGTQMDAADGAVAVAAPVIQAASEAELPGTEMAPANVAVAVHPPATQADGVRSRKPGRRRKSRKPAARAPDAAPLLAEAQSTGADAPHCQLAKASRSLRSGRTAMQDTAMLASTGLLPAMADSLAVCQPPHLNSKGDNHGEAEDASAEAQPQAGHVSPETLVDPVAAATVPAQGTLGCSKCRYKPLGCGGCRPKLACSKAASSGRKGRKRAPPATAAGDVLPCSGQPHHKGKKARLHSQQQPPAEGEAAPTSRAARAAHRALSKPTSSKSQPIQESNDEQLAVRPMPARLQHRQLQKNSHHQAPARRPPVVKATCGTATVSDQPSSSVVVQTATLDSRASPEPTATALGPGKTPYKLRSARHHQSAPSAAQQGMVPPQDVNDSAAHAGSTAADDAPAAPAAAAPAPAAPTAAAPAPAAQQAAPEEVRRSGRVRRAARLQYDLVTKAQGSTSPPGHDVKAPPARRQAGVRSASSKGTKRGASEHAVISDSEDDNTTASTAAAGALTGRSTAKKKLCRQKKPELSPIQEDAEEQQQPPCPDAASEFVKHRVYTLPETAQHLAGLSPAEKPKRRRKAAGATRAPAKSQLAASARTSQLQTENSSGLDVLLAAVEFTEAHEQQNSQLMGAEVSFHASQRYTYTLQLAHPVSSQNQALLRRSWHRTCILPSFA